MGDLVTDLRKWVRACELTGNAGSASCESARKAADEIERLQHRLEILSCWEPIETAPKDGTRIMGAAWDHVGGYWRMYSMFWNAHFEGGFWQHGGIKEHPAQWRQMPDPPTPPHV